MSDNPVPNRTQDAPHVNNLIPRLAPWGPGLLALLLVVWGGFHLRTLVDWVGYGVDEGFTAYGAQRIREGQVPYRDFFFLWSPAILWVHALLQQIGASEAIERLSSLLAACVSSALALKWCFRFDFVRSELRFVFLNLMVWSFSLWNVPYSSWWAIAFVFLSLEFGFRSQWFLMGLLLAVSFWFKQNIGLLSFFAALFWFVLCSPRKVVLSFLMGWGSVKALGWLSLACWGGWATVKAAFSQILIFPYAYRVLMAEPLNKNDFSWPLFWLGLWVLSLYLLEAKDSVVKWTKLAVLVVFGFGVFRTGFEFLKAYFFLCSLFGVFLLVFFWFQLLREEKRKIAFVFLPLLGAFSQVYPRWDFQHFLFSFPIALMSLSWGMNQINKRYEKLNLTWVRLPLLLLFVSGVAFQARVLFVSVYGQKDPVGFYSLGQAHQLNIEMNNVKEFLISKGLRPGDPVLIGPNATSFYRFSTFKNITPHDQFFPGYVDAFGASELEALDKFEQLGGSFFILQRNSEFERNTPVLDRLLKIRYEEIKRFPIHFSVWIRKVKHDKDNL